MRIAVIVTGVCLLAHAGCKQPDSSRLQNNGQPVANPEQSTTVQLQITTPSGTGLCSATIVNSYPKLLTAGHCVTHVVDRGSYKFVERVDPGNIIAIVGGRSVRATHAEVSLDFINAWNRVLANGQEWDASLARYDTAVLTLPQGTPVPGTMPVGTTPVSQGDEITITGVGQNSPLDPNGAGELNSGTNTVAGVGSGAIVTTGPAVSSAAPGQTISAPGDSGGTVSSNGQVVGVVSGGGIAGNDQNGTPIGVSVMGDVTSGPNSDFVGTNLTACECGLNGKYCMIWRPGDAQARGWFESTSCSVQDCQSRFAAAINGYCQGYWTHRG